MGEVKKTIRALLIYCAFMMPISLSYVNIIPDVFPLYTVSSFILIITSSLLVVYFSRRISAKGGLRTSSLGAVWMILLLAVFRGIKYSSFFGQDSLDKVGWYLYYIPFLLLPLFYFYVSLFVNTNLKHIKKIWAIPFIFTVILILFVLTNDLHELVFKFNSPYSYFNNDYSYGVVAYVIYIWQIILCLAGSISLIIKSNLSSAKKHSWLFFIPFTIGIVITILNATDNMIQINNHNIIEIPDTICFVAAFILECCIQLGLIPTNTNYGDIMQISSVATQITDNSGTVIYKSQSAKPVPKELLNGADKAFMDENTILLKSKISGGYGFYQDDISELNSLNEQLEEANDRLSEETDFIRLQSELKENRSVIEKRNALYDEIANKVMHQSKEISELSYLALSVTDVEKREELKYRIIFLATFIKRLSNLMLISSDKEKINIGELVLSISESLRQLTNCGVICDFISKAKADIKSSQAIYVFECFQTVIEQNLDLLKAILVTIYDSEKGVTIKLVLEGIDIKNTEITTLDNVVIQKKYEDENSFLRFTLLEGGEIND